jgi:hypothetical protein
MAATIVPHGGTDVLGDFVNLGDQLFDALGT